MIYSNTSIDALAELERQRAGNYGMDCDDIECEDDMACIYDCDDDMTDEYLLER